VLRAHQVQTTAILVQTWARRVASFKAQAAAWGAALLGCDAADTHAHESAAEGLAALMSARAANALLTILPLLCNCVRADQVAALLTASFPWVPGLDNLHAWPQDRERRRRHSALEALPHAPHQQPQPPPPQQQQQQQEGMSSGGSGAANQASWLQPFNTDKADTFCDQS
jgi:hypothetical protein